LNAIWFDPFSLEVASINWTAPELLTPENTHHRPSFSSDIYSLAMVIFQVCISFSPTATFSDQDQVLGGTLAFAWREKTELACKVLIEGERPPRPRDSEKLGFTDKVWEILQGCWEEDPPARPTIDAVSACLKQAVETCAVDVRAFTLVSEAGVEQVMDVKEEQAMDFANKLDEVHPCEIRPLSSIGLLISTLRRRQSTKSVSIKTWGRCT